MNKKVLLFSALILGQCLPAGAQNYNYSYGDSRVVNQNQTGLYTPSATYIGAGTLSRSAQGKNAGVGASLPAVNLGSHVRTAGDNLYNNDGTERETNGALIYKDQEARRAAILAARARRQQQILMLQQQKNYPGGQQQGHFYVPGTNGAAASYANQPQTQVIYRPGGAASYGDPASGQQKTQARQF